MEMLGEILQRKNMVSKEQIDQALMEQKNNGSRLGDILVSRGNIGYLQLYGAVADHHRLPFINLLKNPPDGSLLEEAKALYYLALRIIPWRKEGHVVTVALCDLHDDVMNWAKKNYGNQVKFVITSPLDIKRTVEKNFSLSLENHSRLSLWKSQPALSARHTLSKNQKIFFCLIIALAASMIFINAQTALFVFFVMCHVAYAITMIFKCTLFSKEANRPSPKENWPQILASMCDHELPSYTILIPMYKEASSVPHMINAIKALDYPASKLDIKLVLEADDAETLWAACRAKLDYNFEIIRVPPGTPRTKPRACNYALRFAKGDIITIYDADDVPEPTQLKKAAYMFNTLPKDVVCLQARLNYYNANQNLLTRLFSLEYTMLFNFILMGLQHFKIPIPLGGTSNHIIRARLEELGEWDPYNVTEDADLGTRLSAKGYRTAMLDSDTMEEAPITLGAWIRQRSRWIKGYMQTWLVHMRNPITLYRAIGERAFMGFQCFFGLSCLTFLSAPFIVALSLYWAAIAHQDMPGWLTLFTLFNLTMFVLTSWYFTFYSLVAGKILAPAMGFAAFCYPFYMLLHSIASYKSLWQLVVKPHFWEKTTHGLCSLNKSLTIPLTDVSKIGYKAPSLTEKVLDMKVLSSLKSAKKRDKDCRVVRRKGRVYVINKKNPRFKARQG